MFKKKALPAPLLVFILITLFYLAIRWFTFKGFNGTDDLHYSMLASGMLNGTYSPFVKDDIFAGRAGLILVQAAAYLGGINVFTTHLPTMLAAIACCYLLVFKMAKFVSGNEVLLASSLFYFNPVISAATLGVMPDVYVMLAGIIMFLLWRKVLVEKAKKFFLLQNILIGTILFAALFFKETAIIFIPFFIGAGIFHKKENGIMAASIIVATVCIEVLLAGLAYRHFTGDFFFRIHQIENSAYPNPCNFALLPIKELAKRLSYGAWLEFILAGFYPVVFAALVVALRAFAHKGFKTKANPFVTYFALLVGLGLYFPFSLSTYQPLCHESRHFLFLYPFAVIVATFFIKEALENKGQMLQCAMAAAVFIVAICVVNTGNKWLWAIYGLLAAYFIVTSLCSKNLIEKFGYPVVVFSLLTFMTEPFVFQKSNWFRDLAVISKQLNGQYFYFPDHDNMAHWQLLHHFDNSYHLYNFERKTMRFFKHYYENPDNIFHAGWFIINNDYTSAPQAFLQKTATLGSEHYFTEQKTVGVINAYYISDTAQLKYMENIISSRTDSSNCCY